MKEPSIVYRFHNGLYINLTNRCPNLCAFCIKTKWNMQFEGYNLDLQGQEPSAQDILIALDKELRTEPVDRVVFCGYGEPTMRLDVLLEIARSLKQAQQEEKYPPFQIRLNTNGLGNLINKRNIVPELRGTVDIIYVSLNAENEALWKDIVRPAPGYESGYSSVLEFLKECASGGFARVAASCVENTGANSQAVKAVAASCGAEFNEREYLDEL